MTFLVDNRNARIQYGYPRRGGGFTAPQITLHTYEAPYTRSLLAAATWLLQRRDPGSYHALVGDASPRDVLQLAPWSYETWHCVPSNNWAIGISAVMYAHQWKTMPKQSVENIVKSMAFASANAAQWLERHHGRVVQPRLLTLAQAMRKESGFVHHRIMDPGRRTDPANPQGDFPWAMFIAEFNRLMKGGSATPPSPAPTTPRKDWLDMDPAELNKHLSRHAENVHSAVQRDLRNEVGRLVWGYKNPNVDRDAYSFLRGIARDLAAAQGERAGLLEAIKQISADSPVDLDEIARATQEAVSAALGSLQADVTLNIVATPEEEDPDD